jgi:hypothetical protein
MKRFLIGLVLFLLPVAFVGVLYLDQTAVPVERVLVLKEAPPLGFVRVMEIRRTRWGLVHRYEYRCEIDEGRGFRPRLTYAQTTGARLGGEPRIEALLEGKPRYLLQHGDQNHELASTMGTSEPARPE